MFAYTAKKCLQEPPAINIMPEVMGKKAGRFIRI
jgi:hypothetical protein